MSQPVLTPAPALSVVSAGSRHLRVVDPRRTKDVPLVGYLVLAPEGTSPAELFASTVTVRRVDPRLPTSGPPPLAPGTATQPPAALPSAPSGPAATGRAAAGTPPAGAPATVAEVTQSGERPAQQPPVVEVPETRPAAVVIDHERYVALLDGTELDLTYLEFELLAHLVAHPHRVHSRASLVSTVWGYDYPGDGRTVDVHIARLRRKLGVERRDSIVTVRRVGYKYVPDRT
ncbi:winged helix-turn-helix domain-containing protein [Streptomyces sp. XM4193]|uniref:winged helix-turn-helix domain-containing protein n=1 Tax=Streptomyces sp. XM4193 TaxID=2929782 RepID=UPI001FFB2951|nr:winged helix-turn-helix domain-containing protein [Streptomyces sp. XM4193]MCK1797113.1 winged helix-turn-helix domain-containing protein [Streptomyces sp. XM4193]